MLERASVDVDKAVGNLNHTLNRVSSANFDFDIDTPEITKTKYFSASKSSFWFCWTYHGLLCS